MQVVHDRLHRSLVPSVAAGAAFRRQQWTPHRFDNPVDDPLGMSHAQRGNGGKGVENVAHGAETDHEQAKLGLRLQILIFSQGAAMALGQMSA